MIIKQKAPTIQEKAGLQKPSIFPMTQPVESSTIFHQKSMKPPFSLVSIRNQRTDPSMFQYGQRQIQSAIKEFTIADKVDGFLKVDRMYSALEGQAQRPLAEFQENFYGMKRRTIKRKTEKDKSILTQRISEIIEQLDSARYLERDRSQGKSEKDVQGDEIM